ncbi:MAG TPA: hypothetical protein VGN67_12530 [Telluribacter sp.]|nr:hypothetical protein [Telluribacter sp.]
MKKTALLFLLFLVFGISACQKRQYPPMGKPRFDSFSSQKASAPIATTEVPPAQVPAAVETNQVITASAAEGIETVIGGESVEGAVPAAAVGNQTAVRKTPGNSSWKERLIISKAEQKLRRTATTDQGKAAAKTDAVSLVSFFAGLLGLALLIAGLTPAALLVGLVGFILSLVGLKRVKKGLATRASKGWAIAGLVLNGILMLVLLFFIVFFLAYAAAS